MMPTLVDAPPKGEGWSHEIKHDGYRTELIVDRDEAGAFTRNGYDWTDRYRGIVNSAAALLCSTAIIDGEVVVQEKAAWPISMRCGAPSPASRTGWSSSPSICCT